MTKNVIFVNRDSYKAKWLPSLYFKHVRLQRTWLDDQQFNMVHGMENFWLNVVVLRVTKSNECLRNTTQAWQINWYASSKS